MCYRTIEKTFFNPMKNLNQISELQCINEIIIELKKNNHYRSLVFILNIFVSSASRTQSSGSTKNIQNNVYY